MIQCDSTADTSFRASSEHGSEAGTTQSMRWKGALDRTFVQQAPAEQVSQSLVPSGCT
jgi:hypothetical protein